MKKSAGGPVALKKNRRAERKYRRALKKKLRSIKKGFAQRDFRKINIETIGMAIKFQENNGFPFSEM